MTTDQELIRRLSGKKLPEHIGLILDGNRRWAKKNKLNLMKGHTYGFKILRDLLRFIVKIGLKHVSLYALSLENLKRSRLEVNHLFKLLAKGLRELADDKQLHDDQVKIKVIGRTNLLPPKLIKEINHVHEVTKGYKKHFVNFCIAYDGQAEIVDAVKSIINKGVSAESINRKSFKDYLYTNESPALDLIVRTGMGDAARISGFMLWDASYAEFKFRNEFWPDYTKEMLVEDLTEYSQRHRRFGK